MAAFKCFVPLAICLVFLAAVSARPAKEVEGTTEKVFIVTPSKVIDPRYLDVFNDKTYPKTTVSPLLRPEPVVEPRKETSVTEKAEEMTTEAVTEETATEVDVTTTEQSTEKAPSS